MNLYIWTNPIHLTFGSTQLMVMANSLEEAKELASKEVPAYWFGLPTTSESWKMPELGHPDIIREGPCAMVNYWQE